jgi:hypothetical protein
MGRRVVDIGLRGVRLSAEEVEELISVFEERVRRRIEEVAGRRIDELEVVVEAEYAGSEGLSLRVDVRVTGRLIAPLSYDELVAEAIEEAAAWLERELRARVAKREGS